MFQNTVLVFRLPPPPPPLYLPCCLHQCHHYSQPRCHPHCPQPLFAATVSSLCPLPLSLLPPPLLSTRRRHCHSKPSSTATVSRRCQSLLPPPPPTFSIVPNHHFLQSPLHQCIVCVIGHGISGKDIPIMAHLAKARCWSKR